MNRKLLLFILISSLLVILPISTASSQSISCNEPLDNFNVGVDNSAAYVSVPFHYQSNMYYCGPAALEMVFDFYGEDVSQSEIADVARTYPYVTFKDELRRASHFSNLSTSLGDGMPGNITGYSARKIGYAAFEHWGLTIDDLKTLIDKREPLIVLMWWTPSKVYGHYRVAVGYNETHIIMHDPWNKDIWGGIYGGANTSMTYSTFLDLWEYSGNWGLWTHPWYIELQMPSTVNQGDNFEVTANITYPCSTPFDIADYPASSCRATIKLHEDLELDPGETTQHSLGNIAAGNSVQTSWSIHSSETGFYNISVTVTGIVEGIVGAHGTYPSYSYQDKIGGSCINSLSIVNQIYRVHNLDTGLNYATIQEAIDAPKTWNGHTIFVEEGTYYEHVVVDKSLSLVGENRSNTIIDGDSTANVVEIRADNVSVINFTIRNAGRIWGPPPGYGYPDSCILGSNVMHIHIENNILTSAAVSVWIVYSSFVNVSNNIVFNAAYAGIIGYSSSNITIYRNLVHDCGLMGIHLDDNSTYCKITDNTVMNNVEGIELERQSTGNLIEENRLINNNASIVLNRCGSLNVFRRNKMSSSKYNLIVFGYDLESFLQDIDDSNIVDNKTVYYLTTLHDLIIDPSDYPNLGYLAVVNCTNIKVRDFNITHNGDGVLLAYSTNCTLTNITLSGNSGPLMYGGLTFYRSNNNTIVNNKIGNNSYGVCLYHCDYNVFYHNCFFCDERQVIPNFLCPFTNESSGYFSINVWDNGFEGNYWSDYKGTDANKDGIGDSSYMVTSPTTPAESMQFDHYPLMGMFHSFSTLYDCQVNIISNSSISDFDFGLIGSYQAELAFNVSGETGTQGFCRICIPKALISGSYVVKFNGEVITYPQVIELPCSNETYEYLYINYTHSEHIIEISGTTTIPEFPSFLILPLFMTAALLTLIALILYRRKHSV